LNWFGLVRITVRTKGEGSQTDCIWPTAFVRRRECGSPSNLDGGLAVEEHATDLVNVVSEGYPRGPIERSHSFNEQPPP